MRGTSGDACSPIRPQKLVWPGILTLVEFVDTMSIVMRKYEKLIITLFINKATEQCWKYFANMSLAKQKTEGLLVSSGKTIETILKVDAYPFQTVFPLHRILAI